MDWKHWLALAYEVASTSPDPSNQNGAVLLSPDGEFVKQGFNRFTRGVEPTPERLVRPRKYRFIVHAEQATVAGHNCQGHTLVCPWYACSECAKNIIESGVTRVVGHSPRMQTTPPQWADEVRYGDEMLDAAGVERMYVADPLGLELTIKVNGEEWRP